MAKHVLYGDITSTAKQPYLKQTHQHYNEMINELTKAFGEQIAIDSTKVTKLWGCINTGTGTGIGNSAIISAGAVYYNGEIYQVPAFTTASIVNGLLGVVTTGYVSGVDPVTFSDNTTHSVHEIKTIIITDLTAAGDLAYSNWQTAAIDNLIPRVNNLESDIKSNTSTVSGSYSTTAATFMTITPSVTRNYQRMAISVNMNITNNGAVPQSLLSTILIKKNGAEVKRIELSIKDDGSANIVSLKGITTYTSGDVITVVGQIQGSPSGTPSITPYNAILICEAIN